MKTDKADGVLILEGFLPYRLSVLSNTISSLIADAYSDRYELSIPEWRVMAVLGRFPGLSAAEVASRTAMDKVAVSRAVARLTEAGRVRRETSDEDRRRSVLELTPGGRALYRRITPILLKYERDLLEGLDDDERTQLNAVLTKLMDRARSLGSPS